MLSPGKSIGFLSCRRRAGPESLKAPAELGRAGCTVTRFCSRERGILSARQKGAGGVFTGAAGRDALDCN